ncbi:MAG: hypothetical protein IPK06_04625 [Ignavibacteriae bacterium]|nr:hypothetical protein [Ignavibacteriota bacterium]
MKKAKQNLKLTFIILSIAVIVSSCNMVSPEDVKSSGRIKVNLIFKSTGEINIADKDILITQARDFKVFKGENYADVFQNPNQFLEYTDSIVTFNLLKAAKNESVIQVAYGSVPPLSYDSLLFQIAPSNFLILENENYPLTTNYNELSIENNFTKVVRIKNSLIVNENKTTTINIEFKVEDLVFRILDDFVFSAKVDTFYVSNE